MEDSRKEKIKNLSLMISEDNYEESLDKLEAQAKVEGSVQADDVVCMWQPLEFSLTVNQLLESI